MKLLSQFLLSTALIASIGFGFVYYSNTNTQIEELSSQIEKLQNQVETKNSQEDKISQNFSMEKEGNSSVLSDMTEQVNENSADNKSLESDDWQSYVNEEIGISFEYPVNYGLEEPTADSGVVIIKEENKEEYLQIQILDTAPPDFNTYKPNGADYVGSTKIGSNNAYEFYTETPIGEGVLESYPFTSYVVVIGEKRWIQFEYYGKNLDFSRIIESIQFIDTEKSEDPTYESFSYPYSHCIERNNIYVDENDYEKYEWFSSLNEKYIEYDSQGLIGNIDRYSFENCLADDYKQFLFIPTSSEDECKKIFKYNIEEDYLTKISDENYCADTLLMMTNEYIDFINSDTTNPYNGRFYYHEDRIELLTKETVTIKDIYQENNSWFLQIKNFVKTRLFIEIFENPTSELNKPTLISEDVDIYIYYSENKEQLYRNIPLDEFNNYFHNQMGEFYEEDVPFNLEIVDSKIIGIKQQFMQ